MRAQIAICGAGIAGISAAYHLAVHQGFHDVVLIDPEPPLSVTSDKSTECYRNWWPGPGDAMVALMNRSIDWLEKLAVESGDAFHLTRRGYLYLTARPEKALELRESAAAISRLGAGPLRVHSGEQASGYRPAQPHGFAGEPDGADLILDPGLLRRHFPGITEQAIAGLHVRRAGWFSAQQLGAYLLEQARRQGARLLQARLAGVETAGGRVRALFLEDGSRLEMDALVLAPGPLLGQAGRMLGLDLPVHTELHLKAAISDPRHIVSRQAPLLIWTDPQRLDWSAEERAELASDPESRWLLDEFPSGVHTRPEGGEGASTILMLWEYRTHRIEPVFPLPLDPLYPEIVLRGLAAMLPGLQGYLGSFSRPSLDGGYYIRTPENRPLVGPLPVEGAYLLGALSGFGLMAACAAGELLALHVAGGPLPVYAPAFRLERYQDPDYQARLAQAAESGQL